MDKMVTVELSDDEVKLLLRCHDADEKDSVSRRDYRAAHYHKMRGDALQSALAEPVQGMETAG